MYVYQAELYCDDCGERIRREINAAGDAPADPEDEYSYDSDEYPKTALEGESDSPNHCASREDCLNPLDLFDYGLTTSDPLYGAEVTHIGALIDESLTEAGVAYLREMLSEPDPTPYQRALLTFWREAYADELSA